MDDTLQEKFDIIDERLDHYRDRIDVLETAYTVEEQEEKAERTHNWEIAITLLVAVETVATLVMMALYFKHG